MNYIELWQLTGSLPSDFLCQALDDAGDAATFTTPALIAATLAAARKGVPPSESSESESSSAPDINDAVARMLGVWSDIQTDVQQMIDGRVAQRFPVPFTAPLPAIVITAAKTFALELLYNRRGFTGEEKNPYYTQAEKLRTRLEKIGRNEEQIEPAKKPVRPPAVFIGGRSKITPNGGRGGMLA